jgi:hypothetical protein
VKFRNTFAEQKRQLSIMAPTSFKLNTGAEMPAVGFGMSLPRTRECDFSPHFTMLKVVINNPLGWSQSKEAPIH